MAKPSQPPAITCEDDTRRWRVGGDVLAPILSIVMPVRVARRLDHSPLVLAWLAHAGGLIVIGIIWLLLAAWVAGGFSGFTRELYEMAGRLMFEAERALADPQGVGEVIASWLTGGLAVEFLVCVWAWLATSWRARPEPWARTFRRVLVRSWLTTSHVIVYIVAFTVSVVYIEAAVESRGHILWNPIEQTLFLGVGLLLGMTGLGVGLWIVSAGGWRAHCQWPAQCEGCGYTLLGLGSDQNCPECGRAMSQSLRPDSRAGIDQGYPLDVGGHRWASTEGEMRVQPYKSRGLFGSYLQLSALAVMTPTKLGRRLKLMTPSRLPTRFVPVSLFLLGIATGLFIYAMSAATTVYSADHGLEFWEFATAFMAVSGVLWPGYIGMVLLGGSFNGAVSRQFAGRNLLPIAGQASLYLSGYLVASAVLLMTYGVISVAIETRIESPRHVAIVGGFNLMELLTYGFLVLATSLFAGYLILGGRITWAGRYANR